MLLVYFSVLKFSKEFKVSSYVNCLYILEITFFTYCAINFIKPTDLSNIFSFSIASLNDVFRRTSHARLFEPMKAFAIISLLRDCFQAFAQVHA